eukprot:CAMPEP_0177728438 /NCGR_PEP_ID=MMETSP0484_2-20121128/20881_1 /TAXON_ID=354590 /ORGANISM="Rhodomonas lens, Strain RHODO" /LENGTH=70 /DNA_ID=CAMNT_0019241211 /DNA_START=24 /DNA_END=236 /DNA_ORIENTATION=+
MDRAQATSATPRSSKLWTSHAASARCDLCDAPLLAHLASLLLALHTSQKVATALPLPPAPRFAISARGAL